MPTELTGMESKTITFDVDRIIAALAYHLKQEHQRLWKQIDHITPESLESYVEWLTSNEVTVSVSAFQWRRMTDGERLAWLFEATNHQVEMQLTARVGEVKPIKKSKQR